MRLGKTALSHFTSQIVVTFAGFVATWLIAFLLGAEGLGRYSVIVSLGFFWLVIPSNAVDLAVKKRMSEQESPSQFFGGGVLLNVVITAVLVGLVLSAETLLGGIISRDRELMIVLIEFNVEIAGLLVAAVTFKTVSAALQGQKRVAATGWLKASERVLRTGFQVAALWIGLGVAGISFGHAGSLALVAIVGLLLTRYRPSLPTLDQVKSLLDYARYSWVSALRGRVFGWMDTLVLSFFVSASFIGIYEAAWGIASMLAIASSSISQTLFPEVSELSTTARYDRITHYLDEAIAFSGIFVIPGLFGTFVLGERVLRFYRPEFGQGTTVLLILIVAYLADVFASQFTNVINGIDRPDAAFRVNTVFITTNIVLNIILVWWIGWVGAAIATAVSSMVRTFSGYWVLRKILGEIRIPIGSLNRQVIAASVMAGAVYLALPFAPRSRIGTILLAGFGGIAYFGVLLLIAPRIRSKGVSLFSEIGS